MIIEIQKQVILHGVLKIKWTRRFAAICGHKNVQPNISHQVQLNAFSTILTFQEF